MIVEFIGVPGSGKSTISSLVRDDHELKLQNLSSSEEFFEEDEYALKRSYEILRSIPLFIFDTIRLNFHRNKFNLHLWYRTLRSNLKIYIKSFKKNKGGIEVLDPGSLMLILNGLMYLKKIPSERYLYKSVERYLKSDVVIFLSTDYNTMISRLESRERGYPLRMRDLNDRQKKRLLNNTIAFMNFVEIYCIKNKKKFYKFSNTQSIPMIKALIKNKLRK